MDSPARTHVFIIHSKYRRRRNAQILDKVAIRLMGSLPCVLGLPRRALNQAESMRNENILVHFLNVKTYGQCLGVNEPTSKSMLYSLF